MERFDVAQLDARVIEQIQRFEKQLQDQTGQEVALVAYQSAGNRSGGIGKNVK